MNQFEVQTIYFRNITIDLGKNKEKYRILTWYLRRKLKSRDANLRVKMQA